MAGYKVGDTVEILGSYLSSGEVYHGAIHDIGKVTEITQIDDRRIYFEKATWAPVSQAHKSFKVIKEKKMTEIQKGDVVKITGNTNSSANSVGDVGVVGDEHPRSGSKKVHVIGREQIGNYTRPDEMVLLAREGSVSVDGDGDYVKVLSVGKAGVEISDFYGTKEGAETDNRVDVYERFDDISDYRLTEDTKVKEVTLYEIAKKFGVSVEEIRVKE